MNLIATLLPPANIALDLDASSKQMVFERAGELFERNHNLSHRAVFESLSAREKLGSTGLGQGIAVPHGRIKGLAEATGALLRLRSPIPFDAPDGAPVSLIFVLLVPAHATDLHLQILGELAQVFSDTSLRKQLMATNDPAHARQLITGLPLDGTSQR
jgi:PTS system nitrogen regulatory IIA component